MGKYGPWIVDIISFNDAHVANEYQEIHLNSAMNIDSVKINTSLLMMRECEIHPQRPRDFPRPKRRRSPWKILRASSLPFLLPHQN